MKFLCSAEAARRVGSAGNRNNRFEESIQPFMKIRTGMKKIGTRLLTSTIALLTLGFGIAHFAQTPAHAAPPVLVPYPSLYEALDSAAIFTQGLNRTLQLLLSYNDTIAFYNATEPALLSDSEALSDEAHDHDHDEMPAFPLQERFAAPVGYQSLSLLSSAMYQGLNLLALHSDAVDRAQRGLMIEALPMIVPVEGTFTSGFGMRNHPILRGRRMHKGLDIAAPTGTQIYATGGGTVVFSGRKNGYGNVVVIDHGYGYTTLYAHCSRLLVEEGATVSRGDIVALVGSTGRSTGPHLHYEVRLNDTHMNPELFLIYPREKTEMLAAVADHYLTF